MSLPSNHVRYGSMVASLAAVVPFPIRDSSPLNCYVQSSATFLRLCLPWIHFVRRSHLHLHHLVRLIIGVITRPMTGERLSPYPGLGPSAFSSEPTHIYFILGCRCPTILSLVSPVRAPYKYEAVAAHKPYTIRKFHYRAMVTTGPASLRIG